MTDTESLITPALVSEVAQAVTAETLDAFVTALPAESVPIYLAALIDAATNLRTMTKALEGRLVEDNQVGKHWTINGTRYGFWGSLKHGWRDIPNLIDNLMRLGMTPLTISQAVSELRITDLRAAASSLNGEQRSEALELIEGQRYDKGDRGSPRFQIVDEKYARPLDRVTRP